MTSSSLENVSKYNRLLDRRSNLIAVTLDTVVAMERDKLV